MDHFAEFDQPDLPCYSGEALFFRPSIYCSRNNIPPVKLTAKQTCDKLRSEWGATRLCEAVTGDTFVKPFFDFDLNHTGLPTADFIATTLEKDVIEPIVRVLGCDSSAIAIASSHGWTDETNNEYKVSFRAYVQGYVTRVRDLRTLVGPENLLGPPFDHRVYPTNAERVLRCVGAIKGVDPKTGRNDVRVLVPIDPTRPYTDYLVQFLLGGEDTLEGEEMRSPRPR